MGEKLTHINLFGIHGYYQDLYTPGLELFGGLFLQNQDDGQITGRMFAFPRGVRSGIIEGFLRTPHCDFNVTYSLSDEGSILADNSTYYKEQFALQAVDQIIWEGIREIAADAGWFKTERLTTKVHAVISPFPNRFQTLEQIEEEINLGIFNFPLKPTKSHSHTYIPESFSIEPRKDRIKSDTTG